MSTTPPWYICIKYNCQCITVISLGDVTGANMRAELGSSIHSVCMRVCACGCSQWKCRLIKHDELLITPTSSTQPSTLCLTWQFASPLFRLFNSSLSPTMSLLGVTVCLFVSVETFVSFLEGNLLLYFCFYFVKLMIHIVLEPPATIKTVKSYSCSYCLFFIFYWCAAFAKNGIGHKRTANHNTLEGPIKILYAVYKDLINEVQCICKQEYVYSCLSCAYPQVETGLQLTLS